MSGDNTTVNQYGELASSVKALKQAIIQAQSAVASEANRVMLRLYLGIGCFVSQKTRKGVWGTGATDAIAEQLQREMPGLRGFGGSQLRRMRLFFEEWEACLNCAPAAHKMLGYLSSEVNCAPLAHNLPVSFDSCNCVSNLKSVDNVTDFAVIPVDWFLQFSKDATLTSDEFFAISFSHHIEILNKAKTLEERLFYIHATALNRWSKLTLRKQLAADIYHHAGTMPSNFQNAIPNTQLAVKTLGMFRDEYLLDFINTEELNISNPDDIDEPVIEHAIVTHIRQFIMTFGRDFSFISNQYRLDVEGHELFIDLLFFNRELNCLVAVELKKGEFKSAYLGQLNLYLQALDDQIRKPHENPSVGIILCKNADKAFVEYAVRDYQKPMGVATYRTADEMPEQLRKALPDIEELKLQLNKAIDDNGGKNE